jgi:hypothetical protein
MEIPGHFSVEIYNVIAKIDELAPAPKPRGPYKKRSDENSN